jgi:hypothetical protein
MRAVPLRISKISDSVDEVARYGEKRDPRRSSGFFGDIDVTASVRDSNGSAYWSARASNASSLLEGGLSDNYVPPRDPRRSSGFFGNYDPLRNSDASAYWSARASNASSKYVSARFSNVSTFDWVSSSPSGIRSQTTVTEESEFQKLFNERTILQPVLEELNWSGKPAGSGQHVEFASNEKPPLEEICLLGQSFSAEVHKVRCKRIFFWLGRS